MRGLYSDSENSGPIKAPKTTHACIQKMKDFIFSRTGVQIIAWTFTLFLIILLSLTVPSSDLAHQVLHVISSLLVSICLTISIFARYAWFEHFPLSAILNIGLTFTLSFFQIGLAATDLAFTKKAR